MKYTILLLLLTNLTYSADEAFKATLNVVAGCYTANQSIRIERLVVSGIPFNEAVEFIKNSTASMSNVAQLVSSGVPLQIAQDVAGKVPEAVKYIVKDNPKVGLGLIGASAAGYMGYKCIKDTCTLDFVVDAKNKLVGIFVAPANLKEVAERNSIEIEEEFVELIPAMPISHRISTARLRLFATTEEMDNKNGSDHWRSEYAKRLKEEEDADRKLALEQGTLDD